MDSGIELLERDGWARLGRIETPHGPIETPALLPVVHPAPDRQPVSPRWMYEALGIRAVITSAYISWKQPELQARVRAEGFHRLLGFPGAIMTDSGAFQQHVYGQIELTPDASIDFQQAGGSDIATVLDIFTEPTASWEEARAAAETTRERAAAARRRSPGFLAVPVQGGSYPDLRREAARAASELGEIAAIGGVVPWFETYRFAELVPVLAAVRRGLEPPAAVHLFGTGHPMLFAFGALWGVDLFDSSAYAKFARRGDLLLPDGTVPIDSVKEPICFCRLCEETPLPEVAGLPEKERERALARHNLLTSVEEIHRVRRAIREGTLWELVERRAVGHPSLYAALRSIADHAPVFLPVEPVSRRAFREVVPESRRRPAIALFHERLGRRANPVPTARTVELPKVPLIPDVLSALPTETTTGEPIDYRATTPVGPVPLALSEVYPVGPYLSVEEFSSPVAGRVRQAVATAREQLRSVCDLDRDWGPAWDARQRHALLAWNWGETVAEDLERENLTVQRSRRTGRLRTLRVDGSPAFVVGDEGIPRPTWRGAKMLHAATCSPAARVRVEPDAVPFVREGKTLFSRFARAEDSSLRPGSSALLVDEDDQLLAVGRLMLTPHELGRFRRGVAAVITAHARRPEESGAD